MSDNSSTFTFTAPEGTTITVVPGPATPALVAAGGLRVLLRRRRG